MEGQMDEVICNKNKKGEELLRIRITDVPKKQGDGGKKPYDTGREH